MWISSPVTPYRFIVLSQCFLRSAIPLRCATYNINAHHHAWGINISQKTGLYFGIIPSEISTGHHQNRTINSTRARTYPAPTMVHSNRTQKMSLLLLECTTPGSVPALVQIRSGGKGTSQPNPPHLRFGSYLDEVTRVPGRPSTPMFWCRRFSIPMIWLIFISDLPLGGTVDRYW